MKRLDKTEIVFKILSYVLLTIFAVLCIYPLIYVLAVSLSDTTGYYSNQISLLPLISDGNGGVKVGIAWGVYGDNQSILNGNAFLYILSQKQFWFAYCNTIFYAFYGTIVSMVVAVTGGYALSKTRLMWGRGFNFLLTFTMWFNAGIIATYKNFVDLGIDNKYGFIFGLGFNAFNIVLLRNGFKGVPTEIEEAATIDGATEFQLLTKIYIPMSKSTIATVTMFYALARWNGYYWASVLLGSYEDKPLQVYMREMLDQGDTAKDWDTMYNFSQDGFMFAMVVCSIIPIIIIYPTMQKYFAAGVNLGGVKE
jgi:putative aldouronate transport system permease protein